MKTLFSGSLILFVVSLILVWSCTKDDDNVCDVTNPSEELQWLKDEINEIKDDGYTYYMKANYNGTTVFYNVNCNPAVSYVSVVKNCQGDEIGYLNDLYGALVNHQLEWKSEGNMCTIP